MESDPIARSAAYSTSFFSSVRAVFLLLSGGLCGSLARHLWVTIERGELWRSISFISSPSGATGLPTRAKRRRTWEGVLTGGQETLDKGIVEALYWVSPLEGYALGEFGSKAEAIQMCVPFFPLFSQEVMELSPHAEASQAIRDGMNMAKGEDS